MATITTQFVLPEENYDFHCALNGVKFYAAISESAALIRNQLKHGDEKQDRELLQQIYSILSNHLE
jgi:hypothetical protein